MLTHNFPQRLARLIVYPVPVQLLWLWGVVSVFLDRVTAAKVLLLPADEAMRSTDGTPPQRFPSALSKYVDTKALLGSTAAPLFRNPLTAEHVQQVQQHYPRLK